MSWETQSWAAKQRPGSASAKLVLLGLASCADANHCAYPSIQWLCDFSDLNRKTVIASLQRLEDGMFPLIEDTGNRRGRTGQVKVYRLNADAAGASSDPAGETVPKAEQYQKRNSSISSRKESQKRDTEPFWEPNPPLSANADKAPAAVFDGGLADGELPHGADHGDGECGQGGGVAGGNAGHAPADPANAAPLGNGKRQGAKGSRPRGTRLPEDWSPPPIDALPDMARQLVQDWPSGAYEAVCETFRCHWLSETRPIGCKSDWDAALGKWLINDHAKIMRDAKAGVSFARIAQPRNTASGSAAATATKPAGQPVKGKARENEKSAALHEAVRLAVGEAPYAQWLANVAILHDAPGVIVLAGSEFQRSWIDERFQARILESARRVLGSGVRWVRVIVDQA